MAKKLARVWLVISIIAFSSISIYATSTLTNDFFIQNTQTRAFDVSTRVKSVSVKSGIYTKETKTESESHTGVIGDVTNNAKQKIFDMAEEKKKEQEQEAAEKKYVAGIAAYIRHVNNNVSRESSTEMAQQFVKYSKQNNINTEVVVAVAQNESAFYSDVVSSAGYKGLMQTSDGLATRAGHSPQELFNSDVSIKVGAKYIKDKIDEFDSTLLALTAYNQGSGSVHSGHYSTGYAQRALNRVDLIKVFLSKQGYL